MKPIIPFISKLPTAAKSTWLKQLQDAAPEEQIVLAEELDSNELSKTEIAIVADPDFDLLKRLKSLKWVHALGAGVEGLIDVAKENDFQIVRMIDANLSSAMAESVLTWTLFLNKKIPTYLKQQKESRWLQQNDTPIKDCKVGILGLGEMGKNSAIKLLKNNFQVLGWSQSKKSIDGVKTFSGENGLNDFLSQCHILICLLPLTNGTRGIIDQKLLAILPKGASVINFARGGLLVTKDLLLALDSEHLDHAVLDVFDEEPLPVDNSLWTHEKITVLPHIAAITNPETAAKIVAKNIKNHRDNNGLLEFVDLNKGY